MLTQKQERFCLNLLHDMTQREAYLQAGYSPNMSPATIDQAACRLAKDCKILARLTELRKEAKDDTIADVQERQQILTEIARGNLLDYQEVGADGGYLSIGKESPNTRAISGITSRTKYNDDGAGAAVVVKVKLHSPTQAIDLLNKMDGIYEPENKIVNYNDIKILVVYEHNSDKRDNNQITESSQ